MECATTFNKTAALKDCRRLLRLISCEVVIDTSDEKLLDTLFHSEEKKTILLSWLIQRLYSPETCKENSLEDLLHMFISRREQKSFMMGTMAVAEQYKRWKLVMNTLHHWNKRKALGAVDVTKSVLDGSLLEYYETSWNVKRYKQSNKNLVNTVKTNFTVPELENRLLQAGQLLNDLNCNTDQEAHLGEPADGTDLNVTLEDFKRVDQQLNTELNEFLRSRIRASLHPKGEVFTRSALDAGLVRNIKQNLITLHKNCRVLHQLLRRAESFPPPTP